MTEWPVILGLDCVIAQTAPGVVEARDSTAAFLQRLRDTCVATAIYSSTRDCAPLLRAAGIEELVGVPSRLKP
ncbi:hypothetical protein [Mycobacterium nebraskense]|uniref:Isochorismatase-like domain-containing protein n=1 Tax=Mycobacterium nebraskense TaxID=244292 RepID=A0A0F5NA78_9MYCO|nr:hypothetical protein [Mycobacterium nebraskense]KKC03847.1 hypothetical protein WU83_16880 [Mycobacterium nebraskense]KLO39692.1 hypothetical protein ABW17_19300 [Mycobacterium nebraskense]MBI2695427.1 hypothetical protein [Mycobacterium nebraskense]MCV7121407.1 hypothetical protein [Mycobacterium nebraskense]ORW30257.1 hypothetical protein AWC17_26315 [Mycobacterium nebraskense]